MSPFNTSLFVGRSLYNRFLHIAIDGAEHAITGAKSRSGKGATVSIPNLLLWPGSALVIDPKGTLAAVTAAHRRAMGQDVFIVDPFHVVVSKSDSINPLAELDPHARTIREDIGLIADALVVPSTSANDVFWDQSAKSGLAGLIAHHVSTYSNAALPHLRHSLALHGQAHDELWQAMAANDAAGGLARDAASRFLRGQDSKEITSIFSNMDRHSEWLSSEPMAEVLSTSTFSFAAMKERPTTIYLVLPPEYLDEHNRFLRLFINLAIRQMSKGGRSKIPVLMLLEEFLSLGRMIEIERAFSLMAGYNLVIHALIQDFGRARDLYKQAFNTFIGNSRFVQIFGVDDPDTTRFVSERIGERSTQFVVGAGTPHRSVPLRTPSEVAREVHKDSGLQYVLRGDKVHLLRRVNYYEDRHWHAHLPVPAALMRKVYPFWGRYAPDPDYA